MSDDYQLTLNDYKDIIKRRWLYFLIPFLLLFIISIVVTFLLPSVYKSSATILIESQQIPQDLIRSTVTSYAEERIQLIQQRVMTRSNLLRIIEKFDLSKEMAILTTSEKVDLMRDKIKVGKSEIQTKKRRKNMATIAFTLGFEDENPRLAQKVANELVTMFLEENVKTRTERATETTEFLSEEATKLKQKLEIIEEQMALFKQQNSETLPEHLDLHLKMLERVENSSKEIERDIKSAQEQRLFLDIELSAAKKTSTLSGDNAVLTPEQELDRLNLQFSELISIYTNAHPDVIAIKRKIKLIEKKIAESTNSSVGNLPLDKNIDVARIQARIDTVDGRIRSLNEQKQEQTLEQERLEEIVKLTPQTQRKLISLVRDYENTEKKYKEVQDKEMEARLAESLEEGKKAERFTLIEPPIIPEKPIKPNREKFILLGLLLSIGGAGGFVYLLEKSDERIRGSKALTSLLKKRPLVVIPYITTEHEIKKRRKQLRWLIASLILLFVLTMLAVHVLYMPLDILMYKALAKLS